jgi:hypothetical protein
MKKIIALIATSMLFAAPAFATSTIDDTQAVTIGSLRFNVSNNVIIGYVSNASNGYVAESYHTSGSRIFHTDSAASVIYWNDIELSATVADNWGDGTALVAPTASGANGTPNAASGGDWVAL